MLAAFFSVIVGFFLLFWFFTLSMFMTTWFTGAYVCTFRLFTKLGKKRTAEEKITWHRDKFTIIPIVELGHDYDSLSEGEKGRITAISLVIFGLIIGIYTFLICFFMWGDQRFLQRVLLLSALYVSVAYVAYLIRRIINEIRLKNGLGSFCREKIKELKDGAAIEQIDLKVSDAVRKKASRFDKCLYLDLCGMKALWNKDFDSLNSIVREQDRNLRKRGPNSDFVYENMLMGGYYLILFYSTYVNPNYNNAVRIYNFIRPALEADMDPNGRRVLAYYQFYIMKQPEVAAITLNQAIEAIQTVDRTRFTNAEYNIEKRLIEELQKNMTEALNPGTFTKPVIENTYDEGLLL